MDLSTDNSMILFGIDAVSSTHPNHHASKCTKKTMAAVSSIGGAGQDKEVDIHSDVSRVMGTQSREATRTANWLESCPPNKLADCHQDLTVVSIS